MSSLEISLDKKFITQQEKEASILRDPKTKAGEKRILPALKRLIVLLPSRFVDEERISRYIYNESLKDYTDVILLTLVSNYEEEYSAKLRMTTISALIRSPQFKVESQIIWGKSWIHAIKGLIYPDSIILCPKEFMVSYNLFWQEPLSSQLSRSFNIPIQNYAGFYPNLKQPSIVIIKKVVYWIGLLIVLASFFWIESDIDITVSGWQNSLLLVMIVLAEIGAIYFWSSIAG
jgi:hypothetical protein